LIRTVYLTCILGTICATVGGYEKYCAKLTRTTMDGSRKRPEFCEGYVSDTLPRLMHVTEPTRSSNSPVRTEDYHSITTSLPLKRKKRRRRQPVLAGVDQESTDQKHIQAADDQIPKRTFVIDANGKLVGRKSGY
jgi:hypothetical protein